MGITPGVAQLNLYEGSTYDSTLTIYTDRARTILKDLTGFSAALQVKKDYDSAALLTVTSGSLTPGPTAKALVLGGAAGTIRRYIGSTHMAALNAGDFEEEDDEGETIYTGVWDLELTNADGEVFRYVMGDVRFSREVTT